MVDTAVAAWARDMEGIHRRTSTPAAVAVAEVMEDSR